MRTIDARNAFVMSSLLQEVTRIRHGRACAGHPQAPDLYGKTGTTNDSMDAWFAGYTAHNVAVVWVGHDQPRKLGDRETGGGLALPIWIDFMGVALRNAPIEEPVPPEGVVNIGGEWFYEEYTSGTGVRGVGPRLRRRLRSRPAPASSEEEKKGILDLFGGGKAN